VNPATFAAGGIRFAACSATNFVGAGIGDGLIAFRFTVRPPVNVSAANLAVSLSVVGSELGTGVASEHVLSSAGVFAATR
jgi:hypothetical protein